MLTPRTPERERPPSVAPVLPGKHDRDPNVQSEGAEVREEDKDHRHPRADPRCPKQDNVRPDEWDEGDARVRDAAPLADNVRRDTEDEERKRKDQ